MSFCVGHDKALQRQDSQQAQVNSDYLILHKTAKLKIVAAQNLYCTATWEKTCEVMFQ